MPRVLACVWPSVFFLTFAWNLPEFGSLVAYDQQRILQLICFAMTAACLLLQGQARTAAAQLLHLVPRHHVAFLGAGMTLGLLASVQSSLPRWAVIEWMILLQLLVLGTAVASARVSSPKQIDLVLRGTILFGAVAYSIALILEYVSALLLTNPVDLRGVHPHFSNPRFAGQLFTMTIPLLVSLAGLRGNLRWPAMLASSVFIGSSLSQGTRGTWLALLCSTALLLMLRPTAYGAYMKQLATAFVLGMVVYVASMQIPVLLGKEATTGLARAGSIDSIVDDGYRFVLWQLAAEQTVAHPTLGIGPMNFAATDNGIGNHPHNIVLQLTSEWGIPAAIGLVVPSLAFLLAFARAARYRRNHPVGLLRCGLLGSLSGAAVQALVDGVFVIPTSQVVFFVLAGWAGGMLSEALPTPTAPLTTAHVAIRRLTMASVAVSGLALGALAIHSARMTDVDRGNFFYCGYMLPRFWLNGLIGPDDFPARGHRCPTRPGASGN